MNRLGEGQIVGFGPDVALGATNRRNPDADHGASARSDRAQRYVRYVGQYGSTRTGVRAKARAFRVRTTAPLASAAAAIRASAKLSARPLNRGADPLHLLARLAAPTGDIDGIVAEIEADRG